MLSDLIKILRVDRVKDVEEIFSVWSFVFGPLVLEVDVKALIILQVFPQLLHRQLIKVRYVDITHLFLL